MTMIDLLKKMLGSSAGERKEDHARGHEALIATTALLLEIAYIDGSFTQSEKDRIVSILTGSYGLQESEAAAMMEAARAQVDKSVDLWQFTSVINREFSVEEKATVIEMVWKVILADGKLDKYEDYLAHTLADLLHLDHSQLIDAKLKIRREMQDCPA
jgi:uncharacterized tellurite resistance protein B-like protein